MVGSLVPVQVAVSLVMKIFTVSPATGEELSVQRKTNARLLLQESRPMLMGCVPLASVLTVKFCASDAAGTSSTASAVSRDTTGVGSKRRAGALALAPPPPRGSSARRFDILSASIARPRTN